jgi:Probable zinc-ribbon domain
VRRRCMAYEPGESMSDFGRDDPREMPPHFFYGSLRLDYHTAVRADADKQNRSICPRHWYVDTIFLCARCDAEFLFSATEQRAWYEEYGFWVDSLPKHCLACRRELRGLKAARKEYDATVAQVIREGDLTSKKRLAEVIDQLYELGGELPARINETRRRLANQIASAGEGTRHS